MKRLAILQKYCHTRNMGTVIGILILVILAFVSVFHFILFNTEMDVLKNRLEENHRTHMLTKWRVVKTLLIDTDRMARLSAKNVAFKINDDIEDAYGDKNILKQELDENPMQPSARLNSILLNSIKHQYFLDIDNYDNSVTVISRKHILADINPAKIMSLNHSLDDDYRFYGNNRALYQQAITQLMSQQHAQQIIFYEPSKNMNPKHIMLTDMRIESLEHVFMTEGLEGLRSYIFLAPAYITEHGDIFGTPDYDENGFTDNHKLIVVQRFSVVDVIDKLHPSIISAIDQDEKSAEKEIKNEMTFKAISYLAIACVNIFALICMIFFVSYLHRHQLHHEETTTNVT